MFNYEKNQKQNQGGIVKNKKGKLLTFVFDDEKFYMTDTLNKHGVPDKAMEAANNYFDLPMGAWFGPEDGSAKDTWVWHKGNFFD
jgi:hypothetical protein